MIIELCEEVLANALERHATPPGQAPLELARTGEKKITGRGGLDTDNGPVDEHATDLPAGNLDFGKLWHASSSKNSSTVSSTGT
jgi:hypothetical protein